MSVQCYPDIISSYLSISKSQALFLSPSQPKAPADSIHNVHGKHSMTPPVPPGPLGHELTMHLMYMMCAHVLGAIYRWKCPHASSLQHSGTIPCKSSAVQLQLTKSPGQDYILNVLRVAHAATEFAACRVHRDRIC